MKKKQKMSAINFTTFTQFSDNFSLYIRILLQILKNIKNLVQPNKVLIRNKSHMKSLENYFEHFPGTDKKTHRSKTNIILTPLQAKKQ